MNPEEIMYFYPQDSNGLLTMGILIAIIFSASIWKKD